MARATAPTAHEEEALNPVLTYSNGPGQAKQALSLLGFLQCVTVWVLQNKHNLAHFFVCMCVCDIYLLCSRVPTPGFLLASFLSS